MQVTAIVATGIVLAACGNSSHKGTAAAAGTSAGTTSQQSQSAPSTQTSAASTQTSAAPPSVAVDNVTLLGKIDADSGAPGTFTGKDGWPAVAPSDVHVSAGHMVTLTIKEYDDVATALPDGSPYNNVAGGTETIDGKPVTSVGNDQIAHTITIPQLGINIPLAKAPKDGVTTIQFTFKAPAAGTYLWECMTPCGDGSNGMGGAMETLGWMRGHLIVA